MPSAVSSGTSRARSGTPEDTSSSVIPPPRPAGIVRGKSFELDDFDLGATVGMGTFGRVRVVKIRGSADRAPFALKIMKKSEVIRRKQVKHVKDEAAILSQIQHPFVWVRLNLCARAFQNIDISAEVCLVFEYLHSRSIIYRDLKPENVLIDSAGFIKVTDFGFAKEVDDRTWTLCGTPEYLAPEIIQSKGHGKGADWWALGILLFEMLAGYPPFYDENPFGIYQKVIGGRVDFPRHFELMATALIKRLLTHDRSKRYGCLKGGADDIKGHRWYRGFDWESLLSRQLQPEYTPSARAADDTSTFDRYPESTEASAPAIPAMDQQLFDGFGVEIRGRPFPPLPPPPRCPSPSASAEARAGQEGAPDDAPTCPSAG